jgi:hypothetical protein
VSALREAVVLSGNSTPCKRRSEKLSVHGKREAEDPRCVEENRNLKYVSQVFVAAIHADPVKPIRRLPA